MFVSVVKIVSKIILSFLISTKSSAYTTWFLQSSTVIRFLPTHIINYYTLLPSEFCYLNIVIKLLRLLVSLRYKRNISIFIKTPLFTDWINVIYLLIRFGKLHICDIIAMKMLLFYVFLQNQSFPCFWLVRAYIL